MIQDAHIVITGGAGFIGSSIAQRLVDHNRVTLFDNLHRNALEGSQLWIIPIFSWSRAMY